MKFKRICDWICLVLWIVQLVTAIVWCFTDHSVSPLTFSCSVLICVMHYAEELLEDYYGKT